MGMGLLVWSWLALSLPMQQENVAYSLQKQIMASHTLTGVASYYHPRFVGRPTSTGEIFSNKKFTAASNHFKLGTYVKVTNKENGRFVYVKINDRMGQPHRVIDLTQRAARALDFIHQGLTHVTIQPVPAPIGKNEILAQREDSLAVLPDNVL